LYSPGVGVKVVEVYIDSVGRVPAHERETLRGQTVRAGCIGAFVPFHACEVYPVVVGDGVQTTSDSCAARSSGPVGVGICFIDVGVVVEILEGG
jgi:hypothetical protein